MVEHDMGARQRAAVNLESVIWRVAGEIALATQHDQHDLAHALRKLVAVPPSVMPFVVIDLVGLPIKKGVKKATAGKAKSALRQATALRRHQ